MKVFIGNLSFQAGEPEVKRLFSKFGEVKSVKVATDNYTRRSRGFAYVEMQEREAGLKAIDKLHNSFFMRKSLLVNEANDKSPRV